MDTLLALRDAMTELRERTGDQSLGHAVEQGRFQLQRITFDARGTSTVVALTEWAPLELHLENLRTHVAR